MSLEEKLAKLRRHYIQQLPQKLLDIQQAWGVLRTSPAGAKSGDFYRLTHSLAGSGATYGFPDISSAARRIESLIKQEGDLPEQLSVESIEQALHALAEVVQHISSQSD